MAQEKQSEERLEMSEEEATGDINALKKKLDEEKARAESHLENWKRAQADYINLKKRTDNEKAEMISLANAALVLKLLPAIDDFDRALDTLPEHAGKMESWMEGIKMIRSKLRSIFELVGITEMATEGEIFDPKLHEAVAYEPGGEDGKIIVQTQKGYRINGRVLRPAMVVVGKGEKETPEN